MNDLEQFIDILKEIASTVEKVNPAIYSLTENLISMVEKFSASEAGIRSFIEIINNYVQIINRLSSGKSPVIEIPKDSIDRLNSISSVVTEIISGVDKLKGVDFSLDVFKQLSSDIKEASSNVSEFERKLKQSEEALKGKTVYPGGNVEVVTPEDVIGKDFNIYAEQLDRAFSGMTEKLKEKYNISRILEEPKRLNGGIYRVVAEQIGKEGGEAKKVAFYIDRLGEVHNKLTFASRLTSEEVKRLTTEYMKLNQVLSELGLTEKNILGYSERPDIAPGVMEVQLGNESTNFRRRVYVDREGRAGFTKRELLGQFTEGQFSALMEKFPELQKFVERNKLSVNNLENAYHNASKGVYEFTFSTMNAEGMVEKLTLKLDEQGRIALSTKDKLNKIYTEEIHQQYPRAYLSIASRFGNNFEVSKLSSGAYKVTGYEKEGDEIKRVTVYIDRMGNIQKNYNDISKVTREEVGQLAVDFQHLRQAVFDYGYSLEDVKKIEKFDGGNAVKIELRNEEIGKLTLFADNLGRVGRSLSEMRRQLPDDAINALTSRFRELNKELEKYGAGLKDINNVRQIGNITEISFTAKDETTGIPYTRKLYGDAQGRVFSEYNRASQLTAEETMRVAVAYKNAMDAAKKFGGTVSNLTNVINDEKTKITELVFAIEDSNGKISQFSVFTDEAGRVGYSKKDLGGKGFSKEEMENVRRLYGKVIEKAREYGFKIEHLKKIHTEASTGITTLTFSMKGEDGAVRTLTMSIDKYGNVLKDVQRKHQGFLDGVMRNIVEAAKWAIAIQFTYMPLQKLNELIDTSIDNQDKLANSAIALGMSMRQMGDVFGKVMNIAGETATPINEALEGFSAAYRATAGLGNQSQRTSVALNLLKNSLILSKLAAIDQSEAIDILVGALRQANIPLSQSQRLLDKWIAVSKNAQIPIQDLAEAYSVVGSAAINSGISLDKLNGIIAMLAESTPYTGKEVGNILRSFISNMSSDTAVKQLTDLGIAAKDTEGNLRDFMDVFEDISSRYAAGIISDEQLTKLARTLAGGSRRAAPFITLVQNYGRALEIGKVSSDAMGESQKALNIKLDTAKSKVINVSNAFQGLAESIGSDGGVLDVFSLFATVLEKSIKLLDGFIDATGRSGTTLLTLIPMLSYLNKTGRMDALALGLSTKVFGTKMVEGTPTPRVNLSGNALMGGIVGTAIVGNAIMDLAQGEEAKAAGQVIGAAIGGGIAAFFGPEAVPIGMMIGSTAGNAFVNIAKDKGKDIAQIIADELQSKTKENQIGKGKTEGQKTARELQDEFVSQHPFLNFISTPLSWAGKIVSGTGIRGNEFDKAFSKDHVYGIIKSIAEGSILSRIFVSQEDRQRAIQLLKIAKIEAETMSINKSSIENPQNPEDLIAHSILQQRKGEISAIQERYTKQTESLFESGKISSAEYERRLEQINNLTANLPVALEAIAGGMSAISMNTDESSKAFEEFTNIFLKGTDDEREKVQALINDVILLHKKVREGVAPQIELDKAKKELGDYVKIVNERIAVREFKPPQVIDLKGANESDATKIIDRANQLLAEYGKELVKAGAMTKEAFEAWVNTLDDLYLKIDGKMVRVQGMMPQFITQAKSELSSEGLLSKSASAAESKFNIRQLDFSSQRRGEFMSNLSWAEQFIKKNFPEYKMKKEDVGVIYKDYITDVLHADNLQIQLALGKMIELNQKQLDGIYNLPSNATFWVPWQAWNMQFNAQGGGSGSYSGKGSSGGEDKTKVPDYSALLAQDKRDAISYNELYPEKTFKPEPKSWWDNVWKEYEYKKQQEYLNSLPIEPYSSKSQVGETQEESLLNKIIEGISDAFRQVLFPGTTASKIYQNNDRSITKSRINELSKMSKVGQENQAIQFSLELNNRQTIMLDGQIVAQAVSKYLGNQLLVATRGGSFNKSVEVI